MFKLSSNHSTSRAIDLASANFRPLYPLSATLGGKLCPSLPATWSLLGVGSGPGAGRSRPSSTGFNVGPGSILVAKVISTVVAYNVENILVSAFYLLPPVAS